MAFSILRGFTGPGGEVVWKCRVFLCHKAELHAGCCGVAVECLRMMLMSPAPWAPIAGGGQGGINHVDLGIQSLQGLLLALNPHHFS